MKVNYLPWKETNREHYYCGGCRQGYLNTWGKLPGDNIYLNPPTKTEYRKPSAKMGERQYVYEFNTKEVKENIEKIELVKAVYRYFIKKYPSVKGVLHYNKKGVYITFNNSRGNKNKYDLSLAFAHIILGFCKTSKAIINKHGIPTARKPWTEETFFSALRQTNNRSTAMLVKFLATFLGYRKPHTYAGYATTDHITIQQGVSIPVPPKIRITKSDETFATKHNITLVRGKT